MKATIIIPTYNRPHLALNLVKTIREIHSEKEIEIVVVDQHHSSKITATEEKKYAIILIHLDRPNLVLSRNAGLQKASADIIIFFDDDVEITKDTIKSYLQSYEDDTVIAVAGRVINDDDSLPKNTEVTAGKTNNLKTSFVMQFWSTKKQLVDFVYGCNMSFRKNVLDKVGGFDEKFSPPLCAFEEIDVSLRVKKFGQIIFNPEALVYHHKAQQGGARIPKDQFMKNYYKCYGHFLEKHVLFPISVLVSMYKSLTVLKESPGALFSFYKGLFK